MAEKTVKELEEKLAAAEAEAAAAKEEAKTLRNKVGVNDKTGMPIPGTFTAEVESTSSGKKEKKKVKFQPGYVHCRLKNGAKVKSAALMSLANGNKLSPEELAESPALEGLTSQDASEWLTHLVRIRASFLVPA